MDPVLLDRLDEKAALFLGDPYDKDAKAELDVALADFLEATVENLPDKR